MGIIGRFSPPSPSLSPLCGSNPNLCQPREEEEGGEGKQMRREGKRVSSFLRTYTSSGQLINLIECWFGWGGWLDHLAT